MLRIILGVIIGFGVWLLIFAGIEPIVQTIAPNWVAQQGTTYTGSASILIPYLIRSMLASVFAGLTSSLVASENSKTPLILGILLLLVALPIHISGWNTLPVWYHLSLLSLLIPMTLLGAKLKKRKPLA
jgi:hypothetical protein